MTGFLSAGTFSAIPDSAIYYFDRSDITASDGATSWTWPEKVASDDMTVNGATFDASLFGGVGGGSSDGSDDFGVTSTMGSFGSGMDDGFAVAMRIRTTGSGVIAGTRNASSNATQIYVQVNERGDGGFEVDLRDDGGRNTGAESSTNVDDGSDHVVLLNKSSSNNPSDWEFYIDDPVTADGTNVTVDQGFSSPQDLTEPMYYFCANDAGSASKHISVDWGGAVWFPSPLNQADREDVFSVLG
jgi:hypothetical protein